MKRIRVFGMDWFEVAIQVGVTFMACVAVDGVFSGRGDGRSSEVMISLTVAASMLLLAWRRRKALAHSGDSDGQPGRIEELEARVGDLEQLLGRMTELESGQHRLAELEERLDFTERLLVQSREGAALSDKAR
jgi:hypothetical protein